MGYDAADFFKDFFTGGGVSISKAAQGIDPLTNRPYGWKDSTPDYSTTDAYKAQLAQLAATQSRGADAEKRRQDALRALQTLRTAPSQAAAPIAVNVPSFAL